MSQHSKSESQNHPRAVGLDRLIQVLSNFRKRSDGPKFGLHFLRGKAQKSTVEPDIFQACKLRTKAAAQLEQRRDTSIDGHSAFRRRQGPSDDLE